MKISMPYRMSLSGLVISLALLAGCAGAPISPSPDASNPIAKVAVLPIHNFTTSMDGPVWVRSGISEMVLSRHYRVLPNDEVDRKLREKIGVTLGGQLDYTNPALGAPSPGDVGQVLNVDGLVYCSLEDFQNTTTLVFNRRKLKVNCRLVNVKTAAVVWEQEEEKNSIEINARPEDLTLALVKACGMNPLLEETTRVINRMREKIPPGPVADEVE